MMIAGDDGLRYDIYGSCAIALKDKRRNLYRYKFKHKRLFQTELYIWEFNIRFELLCQILAHYHLVLIGLWSFAFEM